MSMILMRTGLSDDMRVIRMSDLTGAKIGAIIGGLHAAWSAAQNLSTGGFIRYMTAARLDYLAEVPGFAAAMEEVGWLRVVHDGVEFPDFDAYFGKSSKTRAVDRLRKNRDRKGKGKPKASDKTRTESGHNSDTTRTESGQNLDTCAIHGMTKERKEKDRNGTDWKESHSPPPSGSESPSASTPERESGAAVVKEPLTAQAPTASERYANRNAPHQSDNLATFLTIYPKGRTKNRSAIIAAWREQQCEEMYELLLAGLRRWVACESWRDGYADNAERFLANRQWEIEPPEPKAKRGADPPADPEARKKSNGTIERFKAMSAKDRRSLYDRTVEKNTNLHGLPEGTDVVRAAMLAELGKGEE